MGFSRSTRADSNAIKSNRGSLRGAAQLHAEAKFAEFTLASPSSVGFHLRSIVTYIGHLSSRVTQQRYVESAPDPKFRSVGAVGDTGSRAICGGCLQLQAQHRRVRVCVFPLSVPSVLCLYGLRPLLTTRSAQCHVAETCSWVSFSRFLSASTFTAGFSGDCVI